MRSGRWRDGETVGKRDGIGGALRKHGHRRKQGKSGQHVLPDSDLCHMRITSMARHYFRRPKVRMQLRYRDAIYFDAVDKLRGLTPSYNRQLQCRQPQATEDWNHMRVP